MKIVMVSPWNAPCGVSVHAELVGREWIKMGHTLTVLAPVEQPQYRMGKDEVYVRRCYTIPHRSMEYFFEPSFFLQEADIFVIQNLEILPMQDLLKIYPNIKQKSKTVFVVHEGRPPKDGVFYSFDFDAIVCFDERYKEFLKYIYPLEKIVTIQYPCHPLQDGEKVEARQKLRIPLKKKVIFNYGIGIYRHIHLLPTLERVSRRYPLMLLTVTHVQDWLQIFKALKRRYKFIKLHNEHLSVQALYQYLHASDCILIHKDSAEAVVVPSTAFLCMGAQRPIVAYDTNFFACFNEEVLKYHSLRELEKVLERIFEEEECVRECVKAARVFVQKNSAGRIAERFIELFRFLLSGMLHSGEK